MVPIVSKGDPVVTPFASMMAGLNVWGQTSAMMQRLRVQANHSRVQAAGLIRQAERLDDSIKTLRDEVKKLEQVEKALALFEQTVGEKHMERTGLLDKISALKQNPLIAAGLTAMDNADSVLSMKSTKSSLSMAGTRPTPTSGPGTSVSPASVGPGGSQPLDPEIVELTDEFDSDRSDDDGMKDVKDPFLQRAVKDVLGLD